MLKNNLPSTITKTEIAKESGLGITTVKIYFSGGTVSDNSQKAIEKSIEEIAKKKLAELDQFIEKSADH